jgi:Response regulator containing CheY-like receiver, AAA-type ATPase, and DNA-binding domains
LSDRHTVLIVDDNQDFCSALEAMLAEKYDVLQAGSSTSAVEILRKNAEKIDTIILDMWIPREDGGTPERNVGLEVLLTTKGRPTHPGIASEVQVVVVTGHQDLQNAIESQRLGSFRYIVKGAPRMLEDLEKDIEVACVETKGRRIHKAIMEGGRLDLLEPLPLREAATLSKSEASVAQILRAATGAVAIDARHSQTVAGLLKQIRDLADEALSALQDERMEATAER